MSRTVLLCLSLIFNQETQLADHCSLRLNIEGGTDHSFLNLLLLWLFNFSVHRYQTAPAAAVAVAVAAAVAATVLAVAVEVEVVSMVDYCLLFIHFDLI